MGYDVCSARVLRMYIERRAAHGRAICHPNLSGVQTIACAGWCIRRVSLICWMRVAHSWAPQEPSACELTRDGWRAG